MTRNAQPYVWAALALFTVVLHVFSDLFGVLVEYPDAWVASPTDVMNKVMRLFVDAFGPIFKAIGWLLEWPIWAAQNLLRILPWSVITVFLVVLGYVASGFRLAAFVAVALLYMAGIGFWAESMNSLAIVLVSVPMALAVGFGFGVWGAYSERAQRVLMPTLDLLQTIPAFAYLLPILILFGFGT
ncbi:MAG: glycine/betaine ABC transporter permease, partial [Paracoccaceae bacterium]